MDQQQSNSMYFMRRAGEEQAAAQRAHDPRARRSHMDLADRYLQVAQAQEPADENGEHAIEPDIAGPLLRPEFRILS
jgi:hypothetical protein